LPAPVASWPQRVDTAAHPQPKLTADIKDPKLTQYKFVYVLASTSGGHHVALCLCKARLHPNGEVVAASPDGRCFRCRRQREVIPGESSLERYAIGGNASFLTAS
jgi:hypothetical protein